MLHELSSHILIHFLELLGCRSALEPAINKMTLTTNIPSLQRSVQTRIVYLIEFLEDPAREKLHHLFINHGLWRVATYLFRIVGDSGNPTTFPSCDLLALA